MGTIATLTFAVLLFVGAFYLAAKFGVRFLFAVLGLIALSTVVRWLL